MNITHKSSVKACPNLNGDTRSIIITNPIDKVMSTISNTRTEFAKIVVTKVVEGMSKNSDIAVLSQPVKTIYPSANSGNDKTDALFGASAFGDGQSYESKRPAIIKVPKGTTAEQVQAKIDALEEPRIYRILSNNVKDVLTDEQISMVDQGLSSKSYADYKAEKSVKNGETKEEVLFNGQVQYRSLFFSATPVEDVDNRETEQAQSDRVSMAEAATVENEVAQAAALEM